MNVDEKARSDLNKYTCGECGESIVTKDVDKGTTPMMLGCRSTEGCEGMMQSHMYRGVMGEPDFVWRKPSAQEYGEASSEMRRHFDLGGLDIFRVQ